MHAHAMRCGPDAGRPEPWWLLAMTGHRRGGWGAGHRGRGGWGPGFGPGGPPQRGFRSRRGDVRAAILLLLEEEPRNGYGLMQEVERRSDGAWRPSPGSIYPALSQLEDEGLIAPVEGEQGKVYALTDAGRAHVDEHRGRLGAPWDAASAGQPEGVDGLKQAIAQVAMATWQVAQAGDPAQIERARDVLADARRALYRLLADADDAPAGQDGEA